MDNISVDKAMMYLTEIKHAFKDDKDKYKEFLRAMTDINERRINMACLMSGVKKLFKGHKELLVKFNTFLPDDVEYSEVTSQPKKSDDEYDEVSSQPKTSNVNLEYAIKYLRDVKNRFQHEPHIYQSFIDIVNMLEIMLSYSKEKDNLASIIGFSLWFFGCQLLAP
ncbi:paired amphipathic helix protein Sin3 [Trifolium repens]|nr:paired amphipathic helix protein Sin3 [Trifolium repens]